MARGKKHYEGEPMRLKLPVDAVYKSSKAARDKYLAFLYVMQDGRCAICERPRPYETLHVDHDHDTGLIRGLLCRDCNLGLGNFKDQVRNLRRAIGYLTNHEHRANNVSPGCARYSATSSSEKPGYSD